MSPTSIAKARLRLEAASVRVAAIEVETAAEIVVAAAVGRVAVVVVDAGGVVVVAAADGTAGVMADTAADDTSHRSGPINQHHGAATFGRGSFLCCVRRGDFSEPTLKVGWVWRPRSKCGLTGAARSVIIRETPLRIAINPNTGSS